MLIGHYLHSLQTKGRLAIPASFRTKLGKKPIITRGIETCLQILPFNTWSKMLESLGTHPLASANSRDLKRLLAHNASELDFDSQGRIHVPSYLIEWAKLKKKVFVAGSVDWVEIWDPHTYHRYMQSIESKSRDLAESLAHHDQDR